MVPGLLYIGGMKALKRYRYHLLAVLILIGLMLVGARTKVSQPQQNASELPRIESVEQHGHALELFNHAQASLVLAADSTPDLREFILSIVQRSLSSAQQDRAFEIARAVITEANHHKMDPLFLLAVITTESQFNIEAKGSHGEIGLMQVLPRTAKWLASQAGLPNTFDLKDPSVNIRIGATYLARLRRGFKHNSKRYVAAYNMGATNVRRLVASNTEPNIYPTRVINNYEQIYLSLNTLGSLPNSRGVASVR